MGLIQNAIEDKGIATISITIKPEETYVLGVPRAAYLRFPLGNPIGEPNNVDQQRSILLDLFGLLEEFPWPRPEGSGIAALPYRWRR